MKNIRWIIISGGALLVAASVFLLGLQNFESNRSFRGSAIGTPYPEAMDFELQRTDGNAFRLSEQRGKVVLIYAGFTNCMDFCPGTLAKFNQMAEALGDDASRVEFIFVTVDPDRDTPAVIESYVNGFSPEIIGLTGSMDRLLAFWTDYGAGRIPEQADANGNYEVSHSTRVWVIDQTGHLRITFPFEMTASDMTHDVQILLAE